MKVFEIECTFPGYIDRKVTVKKDQIICFVLRELNFPSGPSEYVVELHVATSKFSINQFDNKQVAEECYNHWVKKWLED